MLWLRSTAIGYVIGIIPGIGAEVATWVCYGQAKQTSRYPDMFGIGVVDGVIAPEAANNAKEASSLLTTMALGIPGSTIMAILLAAFLMVGVTPGPGMMVENLPLALTLLMGIALANIVGGAISLFSLATSKPDAIPCSFLANSVIILNRRAARSKLRVGDRLLL